MIQNILTFCVKNDLTFVDGSLPSGKLVANDINRNSIYLITPFDNAIVKANFQTNLQSDKPTSVLGFLVDGNIEVKEIVSESATYYPLVKDWHIYEFKVPSTTLQFISRNRTGKIGINFSIEQRLIPAIKSTYGTYGGEIINGVGINTPQSEKYYYINKTVDFNYNGIDFDLNDIVVDDVYNLDTYKISAYSNRGSTPTSMFSVDPSVLNDNFETVEPSLTSQIVSQVNENVNDIVLILQAIGVSDATLVNFVNRISVAEQDIDKIEDGTTVVGKALADSLGNVVKDSYVSAVYPTYNTTTDKLFIETYSVEDGLMANNEVILPKATATKNGLMSANDKSKVDSLWALLENNDENFVDTINELLEIFQNYPESMDIVTEFAKKADKTYVDAQDQMLDDRIDNIIVGTIEGASSQEIIDARQGEVTLGANITKVKSQLAEKATKTEVFLKSRGININDLDEPTRQTFLEAQGIDVNYVLGEGNVKPENTSFFTKSSNLFNKISVVDGYVSIYNGNLIEGSNWVTSDFISVDFSKLYIIKHFRELAYYDADKAFISGITGTFENKVLDTIPANTKFIRFSWTKSYLSVDAQQMNEGNVLLPYESYKEYIKKENLERHPFSVEDIPNGAISAVKTNFVTLGKNLFDKSTAISGYVVHDGNGTIYESASYYASDYIEIEPSKEYTQNFGYFSAFYDENKVFISGLGNSESDPRTFTTPANAKYIRMSSIQGKLDSIQLELGSVETVYEPYGYRFVKTIPDTNVANVFPLELTLPPKIYALVGQELNIYFDNIMNDKDIKYDFDVECSIGGQYENYFRVTPTVAGTYSITIKALQDGVQRAVVTSNIIVSSVSAGSGVNKKALFIGDSTTAGGIITQKLLDNFSTDAMDVTLIGTKGIAPNKREAISGWTVDKFYTSVDSPFVFSGVFNFTQYITTNGLVTPDYVVINLGINDTFSYGDDTSLNTKIATMLTQYQGMIDNIKAYNANIKIGLAITIPPAYGQDSFGKAYGNTYTRWRYKRNNFLWTKALINQFIDKEAQGIYLIPINTNLDTRYNMGLELLPVNSRNTKTFESIVSNGNCHPSAEGYWQIADIFWYWLKSFES